MIQVERNADAVPYIRGKFESKWEPIERRLIWWLPRIWPAVPLERTLAVIEDLKPIFEKHEKAGWDAHAIAMASGEGDMIAVNEWAAALFTGLLTEIAARARALEDMALNAL